VLLGLVPSGFYMSLFAKGGLPSTIGFMLSGAIVAFAMVQGVRAARARRFLEHRRWVLHVLAQLSVAVKSRTLLVIFDAAGVEEITAYLIALWLPVVGSFFLAELLSARTRPAVPIWRNGNHEAPVDPGPAALRPHDAGRVGREHRADRAA
jgi:hypothetical protein